MKTTPSIFFLPLVLLACSESPVENNTDDPSTGLSVELTTELCDDPDNLEAIMAALQSGGEGSGGLGEVNQEQVQRMMMAPTEGPFYMLNLIRFREQAEYADGRETDLTGRQANDLYSPVEFLQAIGARPVFSTEVSNQIDGDDVQWHDVAIVEYPCPLAFFAMTSNPDFQARAVHKEAGVETTFVMVTDLVPLPSPLDPDQSEAAFPPTTEDPTFDLIHVMDFHDIARYEDGANEPERTGRQAWEKYQEGASGASLDLGHYPTAILEVQGVYLGDDRSWDQIQIIHMSSQAGFQALLDDDTREAGRYHRDAALKHNYSMITFPAISQIPYVDSSTITGALPVTTDGVGTLCQTDQDCPGSGVEKCLKDGAAASGFCTREDCGGGDCGEPYVCCRGCSAEVSAQLPFEDAACISGQAASQLSAAPAFCICD